ncbi:hypothetical protein VIGAN_05150700 [Vigna angularis var. angularis]|uniref:Uncharacterized protein n=1 Tax=Vigna angularis var. angularis TaxID=157739 RepID=A0A0S3S5F7_PHAAN|nr:hypothetical protein VIGAN_05150700 [Vigna angularis var. angularis]
MYCSFHLGARLSTIVLVRIHFCPYLATQYASVVLQPSLVFIGISPCPLIIPSSRIPMLAFHSCFVVGLRSLL